MAEDKDLKALQQMAEAGDVAAMQNLALLHELGGLGNVDYKAARKWWEKAANLGDAVSMLNLAELVKTGKDGSAADANLAAQLVAKAADKGLVDNETRMRLLNAAAEAAAKKIDDKLVNKILLVDDSQTIRTLISHSLRQAGFVVVEAEDGADALKQLKTLVNVKLVITDINMPNMNGVEMLAQIRKSSQLKDLPVVVCSTESDVDLIKQAKGLGLAGWIVKPPKPGALETVAKKFLGGVHARAS